MMPAVQLPNVDVSMAARQYVSAGWSLVPIARGSKGPRHTGWNERPQCIEDDSRAGKVRGGIGLAHAYSGTCCIDLDDLAASAWWLFDEHGIDVPAMLNAPDAVQIRSGRENRGKLLYRLPPNVEPLITVKVPECGLELRCATRDGKTVQDVLPPTIHPTTLMPYQWGGAGDWHNLPELPDDILTVWQTLESGVEPAREGAGVENGDPDADPVVAHLQSGGWVKATKRDGTRHIRCPFESHHTTPSTVGDCSYFPARTGGYALGHFHCLHSHCENRTDEEFILAINFDPHLLYAAEQTPIVDVVQADPWPTLIRDKKSRIEPTTDNIYKALRCFDISRLDIAYDQFRDEIMLARNIGGEWIPFKDTDYVTLHQNFEHIGFKPVADDKLRKVVAKVAEDKQFDSAQMLIGALTWDGVPRIAQFLSTYFQAEDSLYVRAVSSYLWTALAGRVFDPGCQADMVPVLVGGQGLRKSTGVKAMTPQLDMFCEINLGDKEDDLSRKMRGTLIAEIGELRGLHSREIEHIKQFVTRTHEVWTPKYREFKTSFARRLVFIGTTNQSEFLADETGNRRWLPVSVNNVDVEGIKTDCLQLWAEAYSTWLIGGVAWYDAERFAREHHRAHMISDSWEEIVREWLDQIGANGQKNANRKFLRIHDVMRFALNIDVKHFTRRDELRVGRVLRAIGYENKDVRDAGQKFKAWVTPCPF